MFHGSYATLPNMAGQDVRIQKYLSECGVCSRRAAEELILEGKVRVNNHVVRALGAKINPLKDTVQVGNKFVRPAHKGVLLFNKPREVVSTLSDPEGRRSIADFLTKQYVSYYPVGRLDYDSTGLVILTNDGELADRLMHPRYGFIRTYMARVEGHVSDRTIEKIRTGVTLQDGPAKAEAEIEENRGDSTWVRISVGEGRNRLIRRIMEKVEHPVMKLKRIGHGPFKLGSIRPGEMKKLSEREYRYFREKVFAGPEDKTRSEKLTFSKKVRK